MLCTVYHNHGDLFHRLKKFEIMMVLSSNQFYCVSLCQERKSIQLDIIMDKNSEASVQIRKELIEFFQSTLEQIRQEFMAAAAIPICYIPCPYCPELHIKFTNLLKGGVQICDTATISQDYYQGLYNNTEGMST